MEKLLKEDEARYSPFTHTVNKIKMEQPIFNPFKNRDPKEVWEEVRQNKKPITREEAIKQMKKSASQKKDK